MGAGQHRVEGDFVGLDMGRRWGEDTGFVVEAMEHSVLARRVCDGER